MKEFDVDFRTNFKGADYNGKIFHKCRNRNDLIVVQKMIWDYLQKYIDEAERYDNG